MRMSEDRIGSISHKIADAIWRDDMVDFSTEEEVRKVIKAALTDFLMVDDEIDSIARRKIASQSKKIPEGSEEWNVLYSKYKKEEMAKKNR